MSGALIIRSMVLSLLLTLSLEAAAAAVFGARKKDLLIVALAQLATNPLVVITTLFLYLRFGLVGRLAALAVLEPLAVISEGLIYKRNLEYAKIGPFWFSLVLNCISFFTGEIINFL